MAIPGAPTIEDLQSKRQDFFKQRRADVTQDSQNQLQQGSDALNRRFTSLGLAGSGAAIGADLKNRADVANSQAKALNDVQGQELQANEGDISRQFSADESQKGRDFSGLEAQKGRDFQGVLANKDFDFKKQAFDVEQGNKLKQMDLAERNFGLEKEAQDFNTRLAEIESGQNAQTIAKNKAGLLGGGGVLGTGLGGEKGFLGTGLFSGGK